jgi:hypothetical protein
LLLLILLDLLLVLTLALTFLYIFSLLAGASFDPIVVVGWWHSYRLDYWLAFLSALSEVLLEVSLVPLLLFTRCQTKRVHSILLGFPLIPFIHHLSVAITLLPQRGWFPTLKLVLPLLSLQLGLFLLEFFAVPIDPLRQVLDQDLRGHFL